MRSETTRSAGQQEDEENDEVNEERYPAVLHVLRCHRCLGVGSDRIGNQDTGARRCFHLSIYLSNPPALLSRTDAVYVLRTQGRENFLHCTVTSRLRSTIDRSTNRSRERVCERERQNVCMCAARKRKGGRVAVYAHERVRVLATRVTAAKCYRQRYYTG